MKSAINKPAFTIVEALISFFITILLITLIFQFSAKFYSGFLERSNFNTVYCENYTAFDHIVRNISQASGKKDTWLKISDSQVIWRELEGGGNKIDKGYFLQDKNLYFVTGSYNMSSDSWSNRRRSLLSSSVKNIKFMKNISVNGDINSINCAINFEVKSKSYELFRVIGLKNGIYV